MRARPLSRRTVLAGLGAGILGPSLSTNLAFALDENSEIFAAAYKDKSNKFGFALVDAYAQILERFELPDRGHAFARAPNAKWLVSFARRPGNFALAVDKSRNLEPILFHSPEDRHFYGHGTFSANGQLLFACENDFENARGCIGIYDASNGFTRLGEFESFGIGPHEIILMPDRKTLCVANGGIETHPDTGRNKLNLQSMRSSICFIDAKNGDLKQIFETPKELQRLSLRHMAAQNAATVWAGGQYQGDQTDPVPLVASISLDDGLQLISMEPTAQSSLANYVSSIAVSSDGSKVGITSSRGSHLLVLDADNQNMVASTSIAQATGISPSQSSFIYSSHTGRINDQTTELYWDNHLTRL